MLYSCTDMVGVKGLSASNFGAIVTHLYLSPCLVVPHIASHSEAR